MKNYYIGIDPGKSGAIVIQGKEFMEVHLIPTIGGKEVDCAKLYEILKQYSPSLFGATVHAVIEDVHALFGSSAKSTFAFGYVCGLLEMALSANGIPFTKVQPKKWQKEMWEGIPEMRKPGKTHEDKKTHLPVFRKGNVDTKAMSLVAAKKLFPNEKFTDPASTRATVPHDGIVDAILLCEYCRRKF